MNEINVQCIKHVSSCCTGLTAWIGLQDPDCSPCLVYLHRASAAIESHTSMIWNHSESYRQPLEEIPTNSSVSQRTDLRPLPDEASNEFV